MGRDVALVQIGPEVTEASQKVQAGGGDHEIDENDEHEKLHHIRIHHAEESGGGGVDDEDGSGDQRAHLVADADLSAQELDDGGGGGDLSGHGSHHGKGHHGGQDALGPLAEAVFKQRWDGFDAVALSHPLDAAGKAGEDEHPQKIGEGGGHGGKAGGIGDACPAHHGAAADDSGTYRGGQHHRSQSPAGHIVVVGVVDPLDEPNAHPQHEQQVCRDYQQIQSRHFHHGEHFLSKREFLCCLRYAAVCTGETINFSIAI